MDWKIIGQWITLIAMVLASWMAQDRRITAVEVSLNEQMKGYVIILKSVNDRLDRMENKLDRIIERR